MVNRIVEVLLAGIPFSSLSSHERHRVAFMASIIALIATLGGPFVAAYLWFGFKWGAASIGVLVVFTSLATVAMRHSRSIDSAGPHDLRPRLHASGHLLSLGFLQTVTICLWEMGGLYSAAALWYAIVPAIATLLSGRRAGVAWGASVVGALTLMGWLHSRGLVPPGLPEPLYWFQTIFSNIGAIIALGAVLWSFVNESDAAQERDAATIAALDEEVLQRTQAQEAARAALAARSRFLAMMSHEVRTPLNGILGIGQLLLDSPLNAEQARLVHTSLSSGKTLLTVLNDVLDFSRLEAGQLEVERIPLSLHTLLQETLELYRGSAQTKGLSLDNHVQHDVPENVLGDPSRLRQVLGNLLSNAIKFTSQGGVELQACRRGDRLELSVTDTGIGIPSDRIGMVFESFRQAEESTSRRFGGTGLGLAISKELVERMGGTIAVCSTLGEGSKFTVTLPIEEVQTQPEPTQACADGECGRTLRVLVAEDNPVNQMLVQTLLEADGHEVAVVETGVAAVARAPEGWDLVLMDMQMPEMDGLEATRRIRAHIDAHMPIVALTANAFASDRDKCLAAGMNDFVAKPFKRDDLRAAMRRWSATPRRG